jgi:hypothetical protein
LQHKRNGKFRQQWTGREDYIPEGSGEVALLYAVLERAILDRCGDPDCYRAFHRPMSFVEKRDLDRWFLAWEEEGPHPEFSFPWICEHLNLDPARVVKVLQNLIAKPHLVKRTQIRNERVLSAVLSACTPMDSEDYF